MHDTRDYWFQDFCHTSGILKETVFLRVPGDEQEVQTPVISSSRFTFSYRNPTLICIDVYSASLNKVPSETS
jgi:hypothetical protein